jgi:transcriptional regulator with XRE-family HTH domain
MLQSEVAAAAGVSQPRVSELERGLGAGASLETWGRAAAAVGEQVVGFFELAPGATPPRDIEHLRRQAALIQRAKLGSWGAMPEYPIDSGAVRSRSIDVVLVRVATREAILAEVWDWFDDVGSALRSLDGKRDGLANRLARDSVGDRDWTIRCLFLVRRTRRNERLVGELRPLFAARFPGSSREWLRSLSDSTAKIAERDGFLWSSTDLKLQASRL